MDLVAIKSPSARIAATGQALESGDTLLGIVVCKCQQVVANQLIETLPQRLRLLPGQGDNTVVNPKGMLIGTLYASRPGLFCPLSSLMENSLRVRMDSKAGVCYMNFGVRRPFLRASTFSEEQRLAF